MKIKLIIVGVIAAFSLLAVGYDTGLLFSRPPSALPLETKTTNLNSSDWAPAPPVTFTDLKGKTFTLDDFKGKVVLLNFWASWCPPCVIEFPSMMRLTQQFKGDIILVAVSNDETEEDMQGFLKFFEKEFSEELKSPYVRVTWDKDKQITDNVFHTARFPETIVISPDTRMARKIVGDTDWNSEEMTAFLKDVFNSRER